MALIIWVRMDVILHLFQEFMPSKQKELVAMVEKKGRDAVLENKEAMKELLHELNRTFLI